MGSTEGYLRATIAAFQEATGLNPLVQGLRAVVTSTIPIGSGLSSSAALCCSLIRCFCTIHGLQVKPEEIAKMAWKAEHHYLGVRCGMMDQLICCKARAQHATLFDFHTQEETPVEIPTGIQALIIDTKLRRQLQNSEYNLRREECIQACQKIGVRSIREAFDLGQARIDRTKLPLTLRKRLKHVSRENQRVMDFTKALKDGDIDELGRCLNQSHHSLSEDYEVSTPDIDRATGVIQSHPLCIGARMTGGGFGGCIVALCRKEDRAMLQQDLTASLGDVLPKEFLIFYASPEAGQSLRTI